MHDTYLGIATFLIVLSYCLIVLCTVLSACRSVDVISDSPTMKGPTLITASLEPLEGGTFEQ